MLDCNRCPIQSSIVPIGALELYIVNYRQTYADEKLQLYRGAIMVAQKPQAVLSDRNDGYDVQFEELKSGAFVCRDAANLATRKRVIQVPKY